MTTSGFQLANLLAELLAGRNPTWTEQTANTVSIADTEGTGPPTALTDGVTTVVDTESSVIASVSIGLREDLAYRTALVTLVNDAASTYTVTVNGTAMSKATPANEDAAIIGLRDAILADGTVGGAAGASQIITAEALDSSGDVTTGTAAGGNAATTLRVKGYDGSDPYEDDWSIAVSVAGGAGTIACIADASTATASIYGLPDDDSYVSTSNAPDNWRLVNDAGSISLDYKGYIERLVVAGLQRLYVEVDSVDGHASDGATVTYRMGGGIHIGPCARED